MNLPWLTDAEVNDLTDGLATNAARRRHLEAMGLCVNRKPNGRPLVMRAHAEAVLSGLAQIEAEHAASKAPAAATPNRDALVLMFGKRRAAA